MKSNVLTKELWPTILRLARASRHRHIAVAYLGRGASRFLSLRKGDSLVLDMSLPTVGAGQTDPWEVEHYMNKGVQVYTCSNLHAKIYLFDSALIIGSANLSKHSKTYLIEAGLLSREKRLLNEAKGLLEDLQNEPVTPGYVKICKGIYKPPKFHTDAEMKPSGKLAPLHSRLWLAGVHDATFSDNEDRMCESAEERFAKHIQNPSSYQVAHLHWTDVGLGTLGKRGDLVVRIWEKRGITTVHPPSRILGITRYRKASGRPALIHLEEPKHPRLISLRKFRKSVQELGVTRVGPQSDRSIKSPEQRDAILRLWN